MSEATNTKPLEGVYDAHFHLASTIQKHDNIQILDKALDLGLAGGIDVGSDLDQDQSRFDIIKNYPQIQFSCGIYPDGVTKGDINSQIDRLSKHIDLFSPSAIGEIGVDFHWNFGTPELQIELCEKQIQLANDRGLPVIIHNRKGDDALKQILTSTPPKYGLMLHCFSSNISMAEFAIDRGWYISFAGNLTFSNAHDLRKVMGIVPQELLLVETDSPYLTPHPYRGTANDPSMIIHTIEVMAEYRGVAKEVIIAQTGQNFLNFLQLPT